MTGPIERIIDQIGEEQRMTASEVRQAKALSRTDSTVDVGRLIKLCESVVAKRRRRSDTMEFIRLTQKKAPVLIRRDQISFVSDQISFVSVGTEGQKTTRVVTVSGIGFDVDQTVDEVEALLAQG